MDLRQISKNINGFSEFCIQSSISSYTDFDVHKSRGLQIGEALQMQIEVQRRLHEQLEVHNIRTLEMILRLVSFILIISQLNQVQRHLQLRIEAQGKYLQAVLEKAQDTLGRQNLGTVGLEAAKVQLSELVSKVSNQCLNSAFSDLKDLQGLCPQQTLATPPTDCSMDSCLTSCEGSQKEQEIHNNGICLRPYSSNSFLEQRDQIAEDPLIPQTEKSFEDIKENKMFLSSIGKDAERRMFFADRSSSDLSMSVGLQGEKGNGSNNNRFSEGKFKGRNEDFLDQENKRADTVNRLPYFATKLDLNVHGQNDTASSCKQFDLNGLSWSSKDSSSS